MSKHIPNIFTTYRLLTAIPALFLFYWVETSPKIHLILLTMVVLAAISDWLDGYLARKNDCISDFGKVYDPLADKWLSALYIPLVAMNMIHFIPVTIFWIRDISSTHLRSLSKEPMPARMSGKVKTAISLPLLCLLVAAIPVEGSYLSIFAFFGGFLYWVGGIALSIVCIWSGIDYYLKAMVKK